MSVSSKLKPCLEVYPTWFFDQRIIKNMVAIDRPGRNNFYLNSHCNQSIRKVLLGMVSWRTTSKKLRSVSPRKPQSWRPSMNDPRTTPFPNVRKPEAWRVWPKVLRAGNSHPRLVSFSTENGEILQNSFLINLLVGVMLKASSIPPTFSLKIPI